MRNQAKYPINLYWELVDPSVSVPTDICETIDSLLSKLNTSVQYILRQLYVEGKPLEEIAKEQGITRERVRQVIQKALRELSNPENSQVLLLGLMGSRLQKHKAYIEELESIIEKQKAVIEQVLPPEVKDIQNFNTPLEDAELSIRTFNCLKRAGINTIGDIAKLYIQDLTKVRNLGPRSCNEVIELMRTKYGIELPNKLDVSVNEMALSNRTRDALLEVGFCTAKDISELYFEDLCDYYNLETVVQREVAQKLKDDFGFSMKKRN